MGLITPAVELRRTTFQCPLCPICDGKPVDKFWMEEDKDAGTTTIIAECHGETSHSRPFYSWELDTLQSNLAFLDPKRYVNRGKPVRLKDTRDIW